MSVYISIVGDATILSHVIKNLPKKGIASFSVHFEDDPKHETAAKPQKAIGFDKPPKDKKLNGSPTLKGSVLSILKNSPKRFGQIRFKLVELGYAPTSTSPCLRKMKKDGQIEQNDDGEYVIAES